MFYMIIHQLSHPQVKYPLYSLYQIKPLSWREYVFKGNFVSLKYM